MKKDKRYLSNICREQFEKIKSFLESVLKFNKPRTVDLYDVFCGLLYIQRGGYQWWLLLKEYPK